MTTAKDLLGKSVGGYFPAFSCDCTLVLNECLLGLWHEKGKSIKSFLYSRQWSCFVFNTFWCVSVQFSRSVVSDYLQPHRLHTRPPYPSPTPKVHPNSCPLSWWCHPTISSSVIPFSHLQSFPASGSFPMSQFYASGGQSIRVSASGSVLPMNTQDWSPLGWTGVFTESYLWPRIGIWFYLP